MNNPQASIQTTARRLRYLRRYPNTMIGRASRAECEAMSLAYEYALRVVIDEFGLDDQFHALFYGPQREDEPVDERLTV